MNILVNHRRTHLRLGPGDWLVMCSCGWQHWTRHKTHGRGMHRDHLHRVIRLSKRKAA